MNLLKEITSEEAKNLYEAGKPFVISATHNNKTVSAKICNTSFEQLIGARFETTIGMFEIYAFEDCDKPSVKFYEDNISIKTEEV